MNRRVDVYRLDSFLSRPSVCLPSATTVQLRLPEVAAVMVLLCWRIKVISGDGDEYGFIPGEIFGRSVTSSSPTTTAVLPSTSTIFWSSH